MAADCVRFTGDHSAHIDTGAVASDALFLSGETFICADDVVIVGEGDLNEVAAASQLAAAITGPLLFPEPRLSAELGRLKPERVHIVGSAQVNIPGDVETVTHDIGSAVDLAREHLGVTEEVPLPSTPDSSSIVETVLAIGEGSRVVVPQTPPPPASSSTMATEPEIVVSEIVVGLAVPNTASSLWMVDASSPQTVLLASAVGHAIGATVVAIDGSDVLGHPEVGVAMEGQGRDTIRYVGATPEASDWELEVLTNAQQVPGGGFYVLPPEQPRRYVAYYGHPETEALGVLGEQDPEQTRVLMQDFVEAYAADGAQVIPTFEIIASVASAGPTEDDDYSFEWPAESFGEWIDYAEENDMYVVLDLQSGRDDFLSQAMQYQELLELPFVGLALDPEWRLTDSQVHLEQTGTVDAAEINETVDWVADLVRDEGLPQKMMIVHQFKTSMITSRADIVERPEIQMIIQMDGDGTSPQKDASWDRVLEGGGDAHWAWGWKNFFDEDEPGPPSPESTINRVPSPVFISYQ
ncbi:MAG: hypothetical protein WAL25_14810 [Acidimicrobiia bacterium]